MQTNTFEGGTPGGPITVANSGGASGNAFSQVNPTGTPPTYTSAAIKGALSALFDTTNQQFVALQEAATSSVFSISFYFTFPSNPSSNHQLAQPRQTGAQINTDIQITTTGAITGSAGTGIGTTPLTLTPNIKYRAAIQGSNFTTSTTNANYAIQIFEENGTSPYTQISGTNKTPVGPPQLVRYGRPATTTVLPTGLKLDNIIQDFSTSVPIADSNITTAALSDMAAVHTMLASAAVQQQGVVAMTAGWTTVAAADIQKEAAVAMSATASLAAVGVRAAAGTVDMAAVHSMAVAGTRAAAGAVAMTATSTVSADGIRTQPAVVSMTAAHTLSTAGLVSKVGTVAMTASNTLTINGVIIKLATAGLTASHSLSVAGTATNFASCSLNAVHALNANA